MKLFVIVILCFAFLPSFSFTDTNELIFVEDESSRDESDSGGSDDKSVPTEIFKATNEWQEVGNHVLPKGLHVRINLETGKKEAKLLESSSEVDVHSRITSNYQIVEKQVAESTSAESLKKLNDFKDISKSNSIKYKNIQEIKANGVKVTSESALLEDAMSRYLSEKDEKNKLSHLADIEYFVHSIDLANNLFQSGGLSMMLKDLNQTSSMDIKLGILSVIGASIQGNIHLKSELFKLDFLRQIVVLLNARDVQLEKKSFFVLRALTLNFPLAQKALFHSFNGLDILENLLSKDRYLVTRTTAFLSDIAIEISSIERDKQQVYGQVQFETALKNSAICQKLIEIVSADHELDQSFLGTMLESLHGLSKVCNFHSNNTFREALSKLSQSFSSDDFISDSIAKLLVNSNDVKDEL